MLPFTVAARPPNIFIDVTRLSAGSASRNSGWCSWGIFTHFMRRSVFSSRSFCVDATRVEHATRLGGDDGDGEAEHAELGIGGEALGEAKVDLLRDHADLEVGEGEVEEEVADGGAG